MFKCDKIQDKASLSIKSFFAVLASCLLLFSSIPNAAFAASGDDVIERINGDDRYETMLATIEETFDTSTDVGTPVILASGTRYADALAASGLAGATDGYIVLVDGSNDRLTESAIAALEMIQPETIYVAGGTSVISDSLVNEAAVYLSDKSDPSTDIVRLAGNTRELTAEQIYSVTSDDASVDWSSRTAIVAYGWNYPDALTVSAYAYAEQAPIFLTDNDNHALLASTVELIEAAGFTNVVIVGGTSVVSDSVKNQFDSDITVERWFGNSRYQTADAIATQSILASNYSTENADRVLTDTEIALTTGRNFPDALVGGVMCGKLGIPMILGDVDYTNGDYSLISGGIAYTDIKAGSTTKAYILGGTSGVTQSTEDVLAALFDSVVGDGSTVSDETDDETDYWSTSCLEGGGKHYWIDGVFTKTVHHDAVYEEVIHQAVVVEMWECVACKTIFEEYDEAMEHLRAAAAAYIDWQRANNWELTQDDYPGYLCGNFMNTFVTVEELWIETVLVQEAYDEEVEYYAGVCRDCGLLHEDFKSSLLK